MKPLKVSLLLLASIGWLASGCGSSDPQTTQPDPQDPVVIVDPGENPQPDPKPDPEPDPLPEAPSIEVNGGESPIQITNGVGESIEVKVVMNVPGGLAEYSVTSDQGYDKSMEGEGQSELETTFLYSTEAKDPGAETFTFTVVDESGQEASTQLVVEILPTALHYVVALENVVDVNDPDGINKDGPVFLNLANEEVYTPQQIIDNSSLGGKVDVFFLRADENPRLVYPGLEAVQYILPWELDFNVTQMKVSDKDTLSKISSNEVSELQRIQMINDSFAPEMEDADTVFTTNPFMSFQTASGSVGIVYVEANNNDIDLIHIDVWVNR
ncbi:MAG: hypothetical protein H7A32_05655 [Deltaproteobacteria bacterium]|nr:hypothetical protein [Deltaproteobacteria bacterium]